MVLRFLRGRGPLLGPFVLWILIIAAVTLGLNLYGARSFFASSGPEHTFEALAWLRGHADLSEVPAATAAQYRGLSFSSLPPAPTLFELPWALLFGRASPHSLTLLLWSLLGVWALFEIGLRAGWGALQAGLVAFTFIAGSNFLPAVVAGGSGAQGQVMGFVLASLALGFTTKNTGKRFGPWLGYLLLSFAVGCRPVYLLYFPLLIFLDARTSRPGSRGTVLKDAMIWGGPVLALLAAYNGARFDDPFEFGGSFIQRTRSLPHGSFSFFYLPENFFRAFAKLPALGSGRLPLQFDTAGNAFWVTSPVFVFCLGVGLLRPLDRTLRRLWIGTVAVVWLTLLLTESAGYAQFGYRNLVDLLPLGFFGLFFASPAQDLRAVHWTPLALYSVAMNLYGIFWLSLERARG